MAFAWTGAESLHYQRILRRRLALGLADPVAVDRMLLWAISGVANAVLCGVIATCMLTGMAPLMDPLPVATTAVTGLTASVSWYLAFLPPRAYLRRVRARAAAG